MLYTFAQRTVPATPTAAAGTKKIGRNKPPGQRTRKGNRMGRVIKVVVVLVILGFIGLTIYAYLGNLTPMQREVTKPVVLDASN
jgi:hypothetical protein